MTDNILYIDCFMGAAGDMLTAALFELLPDSDSFLHELNALGINGVTFSAQKTEKCGILGTHMSVTVDGVEEDEHLHEGENGGEKHSHRHNSLEDIKHLVEAHFRVSEKVKKDILAVYGIIADAESRVHGVPVKEIHFHEVGNMDALADITAVCLLMDRINPKKVVVSPIHVGSGFVRCAHGILPVPAPATAQILEGIPTYQKDIKSELCTPTGAALLKYFANEFNSQPLMSVEKCGYGMGKKDFEIANCVRVMLGTPLKDINSSEENMEIIYELSCNIDDMTPEETGFAMERILAEGALDVYMTPIVMKKTRAAHKLCVLCKKEDRKRMAELIFFYTSTIGVREQAFNRYTLDRNFETLKTQFGDIIKKTVSGYGVTRSKFEYDDLARIARENNMSIDMVRKSILREEN